MPGWVVSGNTVMVILTMGEPTPMYRYSDFGSYFRTDRIIIIGNSYRKELGILVQRTNFNDY